MDDHQPSANDPKAFDVIPPGNTPATPTGRPVIPGASPQQPDPMLQTKEQDDNDASNSPNSDPTSSQAVGASEDQAASSDKSDSDQTPAPNPVVSNYEFHKPKISRLLLVVIMCVIILVMAVVGISIYLRVVY